jgi:hypothetical protein
MIDLWELNTYSAKWIGNALSVARRLAPVIASSNAVAGGLRERMSRAIIRLLLAARLKSNMGSTTARPNDMRQKNE